MTKFKYIWYWHKKPPGRKGQLCRVLARGTMNSILIEFEDGCKYITSANGISKIKKMKTLIVGGRFGNIPKKSSVIKKITDSFNQNEFQSPDNTKIINGGTVTDLISISLTGFQLILWFPDIDNLESKHYPVKDQGAVLICSKVSRETNDRIQAVARIFKIHANAVVLISKEKNKFQFELIDALDNTWGYKNDDINMLTAGIRNLASWTFASKRSSLYKDKSLEKLVNLNRQVADRFQADMGRYFGNCSTRCMSMFPSTRYYFSRRNVDKTRLEVSDMVMTTILSYYGENKPSIDTPVQMALY